MSYTYEFFKESADYVLSKIDYKLEVGLILGSALGTIVDEIENQVVIDFESIPNFLKSTVKAMAGQLILGDLNGKKVNTGLTPTVSVGSTDLHSVGQLYLGGPKDKITTFIYDTNVENAIAVPTKRIFPKVVTMINGKQTSDIMNAILGGIKIAYDKNELPYMEIQFSSINPYEIGAFMQFKMIEMMYLGKLLNVNPFDQPNVESYKIETKQLLEV